MSHDPFLFRNVSDNIFNACAGNVLYIQFFCSMDSACRPHYVAAFIIDSSHMSCI